MGLIYRIIATILIASGATLPAIPTVDGNLGPVGLAQFARFLLIAAGGLTLVIDGLVQSFGRYLEKTVGDDATAAAKRENFNARQWKRQANITRFTALGAVNFFLGGLVLLYFAYATGC